MKENNKSMMLCANTYTHVMKKEKQKAVDTLTLLN